MYIISLSAWKMKRERLMVVPTIIATFATLILTRLPLWVLVYSYEHIVKYARPSHIAGV